MMDQILTSVKKLLGIEPDYDHFDQNIIMHINTAFGVLTQLGVGPKEGFSITDDQAVWSDFTTDKVVLDMVKEYVMAKVKLVFDPPQTSFVIEAYQKRISELEWRLNVEVDPTKE